MNKNISQNMLRIHQILPFSVVNGHGKRFVIWLQGCHFHCPGCFNPETHDVNGGYCISEADLFNEIIESSDIEGISISGGEPLLQYQPLLSLLKLLKAKSSLSVLLFTGYTYNEIKQYAMEEILLYIDILISGRYDIRQPCHEPLRSSANQKIHFLSSRYTSEDIGQYQECELIIDLEGNIIQSGVWNVIK